MTSSPDASVATAEGDATCDESRIGSGPGVYWVHDPDQAGAVSDLAGALADHPDVLVCNPTPGTATVDGLWVDLLVGLGKDRDLAIQAGADPATLTSLLRVWLQAWQVRDVIVLRAQTLPETVLDALMPPSLPVQRLWLISNTSPPQRWLTGEEPAAARRCDVPGFLTAFGAPLTQRGPSGSRSDRVKPAVAAGPLPGLRLFTLVADLRRLVGTDAHGWIDLLRADVHDARSALAALALVHEPREHGRWPTRGDREHISRTWQPSTARLSDPASLAPVLSHYLAATATADPVRGTLRLRAVQLALLEHHLLLTDHPAADRPRPVPRMLLDDAWAQAVNRLTDPRRAGYLALAYSTGLPAVALSRLNTLDLRHARAGLIRLDHRIWTVPPSAVPFLHALAAAGPQAWEPDELTSQLHRDAASLGLPPPSLPDPAESAGMHAWFTGYGFTLTALPRVRSSAPDQVAVPIAFPDPASRCGAIAEGATWP